MIKPTKRARSGGREGAVARPPNPEPRRDPVMIRDLEPRVFLRRGDPYFRMIFAVAGRRYFGSTRTTDRQAAHAYARAAHAMVVDTRDCRRIKADLARTLLH